MGKVFAVQPILLDIERMAAHSDSYSLWCSNTMRTARSRISGEYLLDLFITPSSHEMESSINPGRFRTVIFRSPLPNRCASIDDFGQWCINQPFIVKPYPPATVHALDFATAENACVWNTGKHCLIPITPSLEKSDFSLLHAPDRQPCGYHYRGFV